MDNYQKVSALTKVFRYIRIKYRDAYKQLKNQLETDILITTKEYYNLGNRRPSDLKDDGTTGALIAIFKDVN